jgi:putative transposase
MEFNPDIHARRSIRFKEYDYARAGYYFVTICAKGREHIFASYPSGVGAGFTPAQLELTCVGKIIDKNLHIISECYKNVFLDQYVVMPNHIHVIIIIEHENRAGARPAPTLGTIIGELKSRCMKDYLHLIELENINVSCKIWQRNYYEHVIRSDEELQKIRAYIVDNPANWEQDEENIKCEKL